MSSVKDSAVADPYATPDDATAPDRARRPKDPPARALPNKAALARPRASLVDRDPPEGQARRSPPAAPPPKPPIPTPHEGPKRAPWPPPVHAAPAAPIPIAIPPIVGGSGGRAMPSPSPRSPVDRSRSESTFKKRTMSAAPRSTMKWTLASCAVIAGVVGWRIEQSYDQTSGVAAAPPPASVTTPDAGEMTAPAVASARLDAAAPPPAATPSSSAPPSTEIAAASDAGTSTSAVADNVPMVEITSALLGTYRVPAQTALALSHEAQREPVQGIAGIAGVPKPSLAGQAVAPSERVPTFHVITPPWRIAPTPITTPRALPPIARPRPPAPLDAQAVMAVANANATRAKTDATPETRSSPHRVVSAPAPFRAPPTTQARPEPSAAALARANDRVEALLRKHAEEETR